MPSRASMLRLVPCVLAALSVAACGSDPGSEATGVCELNPEPGLRPQLKSPNGQNLNGSKMQGSNLNGAKLQGSNLNGSRLQGSNLNGLRLNGTFQPNGTHINGLATNELVGTLADGKVLSGESFVGAKLQAVLSDGKTIDLTITSFERKDSLAYYRLDYEGQNICGDNDKGMFLPGVWDERASRHDEMTVGGNKITTSFSCTKGMLAKCVSWGYAPWNVGSDLHQTCTRMGRADYCGTGVSFTKDGTLIDLYDTRGIQAPTGEADLLFEAGWGPNGAVCVSRTRFDTRTMAGEPVLPSCWASLPKCSSVEEAQEKGATMGNSSRIQSRTICSGEAGILAPRVLDPAEGGNQ